MTSTGTRRPSEEGLGGRSAARTGIATVVAVGIGVAAVWFVGRALTGHGTDLHLEGGYVLVGRTAVVLTPRVLLAVAVAGAVVRWGPLAARRLRWRPLLAAATAAAAAWAVALALSSGWDRLAAPMRSPHEFPHDVGRVGGLGALLRTFVESVPVHSAQPWTTHVAGHPPGALLVFVGLDRVGLGGAGWAAALCIAGGALAVPAVLVTVRSVQGEAAARAVAPFAVLMPAAVWIATSPDALFAGVSAWGVALFALAAARGAGPPGYALALAGGLVLGSSLFLSFGLVPVGLLVLAVVVVRPARSGWGAVLRLLAVGAAGVVAVFAFFAAEGYWWFSGVVVDAQRVRDGAAFPDRPYLYFVVANLAAGAVAAGPAVVAGLAALARGARSGAPRAAAALPVAALAGMAVSDLSGLVLGETERIWLPFLVWLLPATAALPARSARSWLALSALCALVVEVAVRTPW